jgi:HAD superfamily hydrolase (TIGR01509 family)
VNWKAVVFDLDGTLADSRLDFPGMRAAIRCPAGIGLLEFAAALPGEAEREQAMAVIHRYEMQGARWIAGAELLCHRLAGSGVPVGVFTRNSRETATLMIESLGIPCDCLVAREDAAPKPDPQGLLEIARVFALPSADMLCVGDFRYDLEAAANAGMTSCLFDPNGDSPYRELANFVVQDFIELAQLFYGDRL